MDRVPERLAWAVETLDVRPDDRILEIGCGRGVAAALICDRLEGGRLLALDRSAKAIEAASARNAGAVASGKAQFVTQALEDLRPSAREGSVTPARTKRPRRAADPATLGRYDKVFAVNVNAFWLRPARRELELIRQLLLPDGKLWLFYDPPGGERLAALKTRLTDHLEQAGFRCRTTTRETGRSTLLAVAAEPLRPPPNLHAPG